MWYPGMCKIIFHILLLPTNNQYSSKGKPGALQSTIQTLAALCKSCRQCWHCDSPESVGNKLAVAALSAHLAKNPPAMQETPAQFLGREDPLEKGKATHSSVLAWRIPWTLWSMGLQRWTRLSNFHFKVCPHSTHRGTFWIMRYLTQLLES